MRILVSGSRHFEDEDLVRQVLGAHNHPNVTLIEGGAPGLDTLARSVGFDLGFDVETFWANWTRYGNPAGSIRNAKMVDRGADLALFFPLPGSKGTWDCYEKAQAAGIQSIVYHQDGSTS